MYQTQFKEKADCKCNQAWRREGNGWLVITQFPLPTEGEAVCHEFMKLEAVRGGI